MSSRSFSSRVFRFEKGRFALILRRVEEGGLEDWLSLRSPMDSLSSKRRSSSLSQDSVGRIVPVAETVVIPSRQLLKTNCVESREERFSPTLMVVVECVETVVERRLVVG